MTAPTPKEVFDDLRVCPETQQKCRRASVSYARSNGTGWACMDCEQPMGNEPSVSAVLAAYDELRAERDAAQQIAQYERDVAAQAVQAMTAAVRERDEVIAACRGTQMDAAGIRTLEELRARLAACEKIVKAAKLFLTIYDHETDMPNECAAAIEELRTAVATAQGETV